MLSTQEIIKKYFEDVIADLAKQNEKVPADKFRIETTNEGGELYAPDWFKYMIYGRGPGKQPPPDAMLKAVRNNPQWLADARQTYRNINEKSLAYLIGRKIGREGTDIYSGKRKGLDFLGAMEENTPDFLKALLQNEILKIQTSLHNAINQ